MQSPEYELFHGTCELDSHADTCVAGRNCVVLAFTERVCDVMPYSSHYQPVKSVPIATVATAYTASTGLTYILVIHEALWMPQMDHTLINPNQLRYYGVKVQDNPFSHEPLSIRTADDSFVMALGTKGSTILFNSASPSRQDLQRFPHIHLNSDAPWEPESLAFQNVPEHEKLELESHNVSSMRAIRSTTAIVPIPPPDDEEFNLGTINERIIGSIVVATTIVPGPLHQDEIQAPRNFISTDRHTNTTPEDLSELWGVSLEQAKLTLRSTTQHHVRSALLPLSRRYRTDRMFEPRRLRCDVATA